MDAGDTTEGGRSITRRHLVRGAAWAIPAVAISHPLPAMAASVEAPVLRRMGICKIADNPTAPCPTASGFVSGFIFEIAITNPHPVPIYFYTGGAFDPVIECHTEPQLEYGGMRVGKDLITPASESTELSIGETLILLVHGSRLTAGTDPNITLFMSFGHTATPGSDPTHEYGSLSDSGWVNIPMSARKPGWCKGSCTSTG